MNNIYSVKMCKMKIF